MPRRKNLVKTENIDAYIPGPLKEQVLQRLFNPATGTVPHGAVSILIAELLTKWVAATSLHPATQAIKQRELANDLDRL